MRSRRAWARALPLVLASLSIGAACSDRSPTPSSTAASGGTQDAASAQRAGSPSASRETLAAPVGARQTVVVGTPAKTLIYLPVYIAALYGFAAEEGLQLEPQPMQGNLTIAGLESGQVDYTMATGTAFRAAAQGAAVKVIALFHDRLGWYLTSQPEVTTFEQLSGKPIGVTSPAGTDALATRTILRKHGVDPSSVTLVTVGPTNLLQALESGAVAAANLSVPLNTLARDHGYNWLTFVADEVEGTWSGLATSQRKLSDQPEQVRQVLRASLKAIDFILSHRDEVQAYMVREWDVPETLAPSTYDIMLRTLNPRGIAAPSALDADAQFMAEELGIPRSSIDVASIVDYQPLEEVLRELGRS